jgi:hypothetical protein
LEPNATPASTQALQRLIWLARICTSSSVVSGTPPWPMPLYKFLDALHGVRKNHRGVLHSRFHDLFSFSFK